MSTQSPPVAIVSGAASGIGRHMAIVLADKGYRLALTDIDRAGLDQLHSQQAWSTRDDAIVLHTLDVRDSAGWQSLVAHTVQRFGRVDLMLNVAGYLHAGYVHDVDVDFIDRQIDINVKGVMYATRAGAQHMIKQRGGHIINVASIAAISHVPGLSIYCASKHAVRGFTLSVAHELSKHDVKVSVFCPDAVETPMLKAQEAHPEAAMTFGAGRGLTLREVEDALLSMIKSKPLELVLEVPRSGRKVSAKVANMFPQLTSLALGYIVQKGMRTQARRTKAT